MENPWSSKCIYGCAVYTKTILLWMAAVAGVSAATPSQAAEQWARQGRALFLTCEFKRAGHAFESAAHEQPEQAAFYYWAGRSYARLADISGPLTAAKWARKAGENLERAVRLEPRNPEYFRELFDFYVDSPEWFGGGLKRALALVENENAPPFAADLIAASRAEHSGAGWWTRAVVLRTGSAAGVLEPAR